MELLFTVLGFRFIFYLGGVDRFIVCYATPSALTQLPLAGPSKHFAPSLMHANPLTLAVCTSQVQGTGRPGRGNAGRTHVTLRRSPSQRTRPPERKALCGVLPRCWPALAPQQPVTIANDWNFGSFGSIKRADLVSQVTPLICCCQRC